MGVETRFGRIEVAEARLYQAPLCIVLIVFLVVRRAIPYAPAFYSEMIVGKNG